MMIEIFLYLLLRDTRPAGVMFLVTAVIYSLLILGSLIGRWRLLKKAGRTPWHILIPFLGNRDLYDICWDGRWGLAVSVLYIIMIAVAPRNGRIPLHSVNAPVLFLSFTAAFGISGIMKIKLARSFGKNLTTAYGLIFLEGVFYGAGFRNCEYLGRTLRKYNPKQTEPAAVTHRPGLSRTYMINLYRVRSGTALAAGILTFACCLYAVAGGLMQDPSVLTPERGNQLFKLFTVNSNFFSAIGAALMIPYAVEGIRRKRFAYPKWIQLIQYSGAICTTLTFLFAVFLILPAKGIEIAFMHMNFWLHLVCPMMTLILLFSVEADLKIELRESVYCLVPFFIYASIYLINVVLIGEANGGWRDIYRLATYLPPALSAPLMLMLGFGVALGIRAIYNRLSDHRQKEMQRLWNDDLSPVEIKIEAYGYGRYTGMHDEDTNIIVPVDIFRKFSERYDVSVDELARAFAKGVTDGLKERSEYYGKLRRRIDLLIGIPEKLRQDKEGD